MIEIRSYRTAFDFERRIYRLDRLRLNPGGVPVRGLIYALLLLTCVLVLERLPGLDALAALVPWWLRDVALPAALATLATAIRLEGRPAHVALRALARLVMTRRRSVALRGPFGPPRWQPSDLLLIPDGSDSRVRRLRYTGPGAMLVAVEHTRIEATRSASAARPLARALGRRRLTVMAPARARPLRRGRVIVVRRGSRVLVRPGGASARGER